MFAYTVTLSTIRQLRRIAGARPFSRRIREAEATGARIAAGPGPCYLLTLDEGDRADMLDALRAELNVNGYEAGGEMTPCGHVYEGLIALFSRSATPTPA